MKTKRVCCCSRNELPSAMRSTWSSRNEYSIFYRSSKGCVKAQDDAVTSSLRAVVASAFSVRRRLQRAMQGLLLTRVCSSAGVSSLGVSEHDAGVMHEGSKVEQFSGTV